MSTNNKRERGRITAAEVTTGLGEVVDVSAGGVRLRMNGRPPQIGAVVEMTLRHPEGWLPAKGRVVWTRKVGFRRHEVGFAFEDMSAKTAAGVTAIARLAVKSAMLKSRL